MALNSASISAYLDVMAADVLQELVGNMPLTKNCTQNFKLEEAQQGKKVVIPYLNALTSQSKASGTDYTFNSITTDKVEVELESLIGVPHKIESIDALISEVDLRNEYIKKAANKIASEIETAVWTKIVTHGAASANNRVGTFGSAITKATIQSARKRLSQNKIPETDRVLVLGVDAYDALLSDTSGYFNIQASVQEEGKLVRVMGFTTYETQYNTIVAGTPISSSNVAFWKSAIWVVSRKLEAPADNTLVGMATDPNTGLSIMTTIQYDMGLRGHKLNTECLFGCKIVEPLGVQEIRC